MIAVTFTDRGRNLSLTVKGHAGYAEPGNDIVCASASILAYTLASIVDSFDDVESVIDIGDGDMTIECECKDADTFLEVKNAYMYSLVGYALLEQNYPQYVSLYSDLT